MRQHISLALIAGCMLGVAGMSGCQSTASVANPMTRPAGEPGVGQQQFDSDIQAANALVLACKNRDHDALQAIFGPSLNEFISGDKVADEKAYDTFVQNAAEKLQMETRNNKLAFINLGKDGWPFPIPLTRLPSGKWFFDTEAGKEEILDRRIGANELETIKVCRAYVEAQREYASEDRDGSGVLKYAQRFISHNGKDGLYWEAAANEEESPLGSLVAQATLEGYTPGKTQASEPHPYHGYVFHILTRQGPDAPGGKYDYIINGNMIAGFALVAAPIEYGKSGVMTFIISHQGKLYQKDLGPETTAAARAMSEYNPDKSWSLVTD